jgi:nitroimidazol reductase NimA-like FMN-containing flavoprotein (pyridoxamine 5'-phosphate oxidase superfamily)
MSKAASARVKVKRTPRRAVYDRDAIHSVLDSGLLCHLAFVFDGYPVVLPTLYWREDNRLYWHGSAASRLLRAVEGTTVCIAVSHLDGLVFARSAFNHSANYRSVTIFATASAVDDPQAKTVHLRRLMESISPDRWDRLRPMTDAELKASRVMWVPIDEVSAKIREGPPADEEDFDWPVWAGVLPLTVTAGALVADGEGASIDCEPPSIRHFAPSSNGRCASQRPALNRLRQ